MLGKILSSHDYKLARSTAPFESFGYATATLKRNKVSHKIKHQAEQKRHVITGLNYAYALEVL